MKTNKDIATLLRNGFDGAVGVAPAGAFAVPSRRSLDEAAGAGSIQTSVVPYTSFTDAIRSKSVLGLLGAEFTSVFGGGNRITVPRLKDDVTAGWVADGGSPSDSDPKFEADGGAGALKTVGAILTVTRPVWRYAANGAFQEFISTVFAAALAAEIDRAALVGAGGAAPTGLLNLDGVTVGSMGTNGAAPTRAHLVGAMKTVHEAMGGSPAVGSTGWVATPDVEAKLRLTDGGMGDGPLWSDGDRVLGRPAVATTSLPSNLTKGSGEGLSAMVYGDWSSIQVDHAPTINVEVDEKTLLGSGSVRVAAWVDVTIVFRRVGSFLVFNDVATS